MTNPKEEIEKEIEELYDSRKYSIGEICSKTTLLKTKLKGYTLGEDTERKRILELVDDFYGKLSYGSIVGLHANKVANWKCIDKKDVNKLKQRIKDDQK